ncbi:hypothetical protein [Sporofaciens musculi]|uniref:hypothetical protein n=1 Tax=Sporofaciens musculi TaxID=2681861 RepID=UPI00256FCBCA|nr:hypothetical protein [Sporofaciens musculi]
MNQRYQWVRELFAFGQPEILIRKEIRDGQSELEKVFSRIPDRLGMEALAVSEPMFWERRDGYTAKGNVVWNGRDYIIKIRGGEPDMGESISVSLNLKNKGGPMSLDECYPLAGVRLADDFFAVKREDFYEGIYAASSEIGFLCGRGEEQGLGANFRLCLRFTKGCPMWRRFAVLMPDADIEILFEGRIFPASHPASYEVTGEYQRLVQFPFWKGNISTTRCRLTLQSHTEDIYTLPREVGGVSVWEEYMSQAYWEGAFDLKLESFGLPEIWLREKLYMHGQQFNLSASFGEGLVVGRVFELISVLSGRTDMILPPDWLSLDSVKLTDVALRMQKEVAVEAVWPANKKEVFQGVALVIELPLPAVPIPFFADQDEPAAAAFMLQWDLLQSSPMPSSTLAFRSHWKGYGVNLNLDLTEFSFIGRLYREAEGKLETGASNGIFPGFSKLVLTDLRVAGNLPESYYAIQVTFAEPKEEKLPLAGRMLDIIRIGGWGFYTPEGLGLGLDLQVVLLGAVFGISGSYAKEGERQVMTLLGELHTPLSLLGLVGELLGNPLSGDEFDLSITRLHFRYVTELGERESRLSEGNVRNFEFLAEIDFNWSAVDLKAKTVFELKWSRKEEFQMSLSAQVEFFGFLAKALCDVTSRDGTLEMEGVRFEIRMAGLDLTARQQQESGSQVLRLEIREINLGSLLEALVDCIIPGTSWYLPWPFGILKQVTLKDLSVMIDNTKGIVRVEYGIDLKILVFHLKSIVLEYGDGRNGQEEYFTLTLNLGLITGERAALEDNSEPYVMDFLKGLYPPIPNLGNSKFCLRYLAIGQRVKVEVPRTFDEAGIRDVLSQLRRQLREDGAPVLDAENNWVAALWFTLMDSIDVTVLLCDPRIYGLQLEIGKGCDMTKDLAGLKLVVLYSKVTENIGMFYARLSLPETFRKIELGAVKLQLGEAAVAIYTNGDFKIDLGFPHGGDFSRSFGLTYLIFSGKGGFYLGVLHGETSAQVPEASRGHFDTVLELGVGISAGFERDFSLGPVRFGASIQMVAIFQGVIAQYVPQECDRKDATYFKVRAMAGVTASVYGEVDFVVLKISFSVNLSVTVDLTIESYRKTLLRLQVRAAVRAFIKILFIKIHFSFDFQWNPVFTLGEDSLAPWETPVRMAKRETPKYVLDFRALRVFEHPREIEAMLTPYGGVERASLNGISGGEVLRRVAVLPLLYGYQDGTAKRCQFESLGESPVGVLAAALLRRCCLALGMGEEIPFEALEWLASELARPEVFDRGFGWEILEEFLTDNLHVRFLPWERKDTNEEEHRIPFPILPLAAVCWQSGDIFQQYDLSLEPLITTEMLRKMEDYYSMLRPKGTGLLENLARNRGDGLPMAKWMFCDYFYLFSKVVVSQALQHYPKGEPAASLSALTEQVLKEEVLNSISGFVSRSVLGGMRFAYEDRGEMATESLFTYAKQQYDVGGQPDSQKASVQGENPAEEMIYCIRSTKAGGWFDLDEIQMHLAPEDVEFPPSSMEVSMDCKVLPYYQTKQRILELKGVIEVEGIPLRRIYTINGTLPKKYRVEVCEGEEIRDIEGRVRPCRILRVPLTWAAKGKFGVECLGQEAAGILDTLDFERVEMAECYRAANAPGEEGSGLAVVDGEIFLFRQNLSMEAQKPLKGRKINGGRNSAYLSGQRQEFLRLLKDASRVNSRGYFLTCDVPEEAVKEGFLELLFLLYAQGEADSLVVDYEDSQRHSHRPVVMTEETYDTPVYRSGHTGISLEMDEPETFLSQPFQMLLSRVESAKERQNVSYPMHYGIPLEEGRGFTPSGLSLPVVPLTEGERARFTQILPLYRCFTDDEDPYGGILDYESLKIRFALLDVTGNETGEGLSMDVELGYTDPLESPSVYPKTWFGYSLRDSGGNLEVQVTVACKNLEDGLDEEEILLARQAYFQLLQRDAELWLTVMGNRQKQEKKDLLDYLDELRKGYLPKRQVTFCQSVPRPLDEAVYVDVCLVIERDASYLSSLLPSERVRQAVSVAKAEVPPMEDGILDTQIARLGSTGELYHLHFPEWEIEEGAVAYALAPLSKNLISLSELQVYTLSGEEASVSYSDVDLEEWADVFFQDFERVIGPDSMLELKQEELEELLEMKEEFAERLGAQVVAVERDVQEERRREAAGDFFTEQLKQNLYLARQTDVVAVYRTTAVLKKNQAYLGVLGELQGLREPGAKGKQTKGMEDKTNDVSLALGKIREDGLLALSLRCGRRERHRRVTGKVGLQITDLEWQDGQVGLPRYYSYLFPQTKQLQVNVPLPARYFPSLPVLMGHEALSSTELLEWDYRFCFSHRTAAQDGVNIEVRFDKTKKNRMGYRLPEALGQYMFLREDILNAREGAARGMLSASREILNSWGVDEGKQAAYNGEDGFGFVLSVDPQKEELILEGADAGVEMQLVSGEWTVLKREGNRYEIPKDAKREPYLYRFTLQGLPLGPVRQVNTTVWVARNQTIPNIAPEFVLTTKPVQFPSALKPFILREQRVEMGGFDEAYFTQSIRKLCQDFGSAALEISFGRRLAEALDMYLWLPILYLPDISKDTWDKSLRDGYEEIEKWMKENISEKVLEDGVVRVHLSLSDVSDKTYCKADLKELIFRIQKNC